MVDNAGSDATATELPKQFPWVCYIRSEQNLGFTAGNNVGYQASRGRTIFFLNPDTELVIPPSTDMGKGTNGESPINPLTLLYETLQAEPMLGMVGPQLRYGDGTWQNSRRHFPTRWTGFFESTWLGQFWANNPWVRHMHMRDVPHESAHAVDWLNGSAMFCRRSALEAIQQPGDAGPFDERFFMYSEELDLCQRVKRAGWKLVYLPQVQILHYEGRSSEQVVVHRHIRFQTSKVRYYQKYFGTPWALLLRTYLQLEYVIQILLETAKLLLRHEPTLRRERIRAYWQILGSGFPLVRQDDKRKG